MNKIDWHVYCLFLGLYVYFFLVEGYWAYRLHDMKKPSFT